MRNFTTKKGKALLWKLPLVLGCALTTSVYAQTPEQVQAIQKQSNLEQLRAIKNVIAKNTPSERVLRREAKLKGIPFSGEIDGKIFQLENFDKRGLPVYLVTNNADAAKATETDKLYSDFGVFDLSGENMTIHEWDGGGVRASHQEFGGRVTQKDAPPKLHYHATHVAGTLIASGVDGKAKGMAYKAKLDAYDWTNDEQEMIAAATGGALVSNHSYGYLGGFVQQQGAWYWYGEDSDTEYNYFGAYTSYSQEWDIIAENAPLYLPVKAAGNSRGDGPEPGGEHYVQVYDASTGKKKWVVSTKVRQKNGGADGFDCINHGTTSKNILVVGAAQKLVDGYSSSSDVEMASFSSYGPLDDGRIKPDITGVGVGVYSAWDTGDDQYNSISGTSMASPNVAGSIFLLQELYSKKNNGSFMRSSTLKALVTGTAKEAYSEGPDYSSGWGLLDAFKAASTISLNGSYALVDQKTLNNNATETINVVASGDEPLKVTIAWTDPASVILSDGTQLNNRTKMLVNDLDVKVTENGNEYLAWVLDPENPGAPATKGDNNTDNVEQVVVDNPTAGATYTITISHKGQLKKGEVQGGVYDHTNATSQDYGLVVTGVNMGVDKDLALTSVESDMAPVDYTATTPVKFTVVNKGTDTFTGGKVHYTFTNKDTNTVVSEGDLDLGDVDLGATVVKVMNFDLSTPFVNYEVKGEIVSTDDQVDLNNKEVKEFFGTLADVTQDGSEFFFGFEEAFGKYGWISEDVDADGRTFMKYDNASFAYEGNSFAVNFPREKSDVEDWLFSNPIKLKGNKPYKVSFYVKKFQEFDEAVTVHFGVAPNSSSMQMVNNSKSEAPNGGDYLKYSYEIMPSNDGVYYIGFEHKTEGTAKSYAVGLDNFKVEFAEGKLEVDFLADNVTPTTFDVVTLQDKTFTASTQPVTEYKWTITPDTFNYVEGTSSSSASPKVKFTNEGTYSVTLKVKNSAGEKTKEKTGYIKVKNEAVVADFTASNLSLYEGGEVQFTNTSTGKPAPNSFVWTFVPSEGVEFTSGTSATSENPVVKFNVEGKYTVKLLATSPHSSAEKEKQELITVKSYYGAVKDLAYTYDEGTSNLNLTWKRPNLSPLYEESFDGGVIPSDMTVIDHNADGKTWRTSSDNAAIAYSWVFPGGAYDVDDWLLTDKIGKGAEVLKFDSKYPYKESYDVYVVTAPTDGSVPTVDDMLNNGNKVYSVSEGVQSALKTVSVDISQYTNEEFYVAYHHKTKKAENGLYVKIDNIYVGYNNGDSTPPVAEEVAENEDGDVRLKELALKGELFEYFAQPETKKAPAYKEFGKVDGPKITGYEVVKDGTLVDTKSGMENRSYDETINTAGVYTYDVYAVYSDGKKSRKKTIEVDLSSLGTSDVNAKEGVQVYPNPSNGLFTVSLASDVSNFETVVYDLTGKLLFKKSFQGNTAELNLAQYSKGVYVLNVVDNNGKQKTVKLVIK